MLRHKRFLAHLLILLLAVQIAVAGENKALASKINKILSQADVARGTWGLEVVSLANGKTLYAQNSEKLFTPASNTKLFTTSAALALIGPDYKFRTTVETAATLDKYGRVSGDLVLMGRGDPNLSGRVLPYNLKTERRMPPLSALEGLADQIVQKGVKYIDGDVVADDTYYAFERYGEGWTQDDLVWEWGAPVSALTLNDNVIFVSIMPADRPGEKAFVSIVPYAEYYRIDNRVMTTPPGTGPRKIFINREPGSNQLTLWGNIPSDDSGANEALAIEDSADFAAQVFRSMLERRGIVVYGRSRARHNELANLNTMSVTATAPAGGGDTVKPAPPSHPTALVLGTYESQPLSADLRVINKVSQNLHAELMLRLLGREKGTAGTIEGGQEVVRGFVAQAGIRPDEYVFFDGSGLSRQNLVTPHAIVKLLVFANAQPWGAVFRDTLPVAGVDGSLSERLKNSVAQGHVQAKTGSLGHVNCLSGYATTLKGEPVVFSIMANNHNLHSKRALETIDSIVEAIVQDGKK
ncbi:MAG TPA: D-alanyl-D-alanine carboxypeptidase/D-alanyl-D-alanine-endopeptidase [Terriglobales bacterium]|nr:D-alanyl-D-alanine carboxypeptidase/D-alanyl-D-alanine-endopeptidase [Terriglobales bacterium]